MFACDPAAKDLITQMLNVDTTRRLRVGEVLDHQWLKVSLCVEWGEGMHMLPVGRLR